MSKTGSSKEDNRPQSSPREPLDAEAVLRALAGPLMGGWRGRHQSTIVCTGSRGGFAGCIGAGLPLRGPFAMCMPLLTERQPMPKRPVIAIVPRVAGKRSLHAVPDTPYRLLTGRRTGTVSARERSLRRIKALMAVKAGGKTMTEPVAETAVEAADALVVLGAMLIWEKQAFHCLDPETNQEGQSLIAAEGATLEALYLIQGPTPIDGRFELCVLTDKEDWAHFRTYRTQVAARHDCETHTQTGIWKDGEETTRDWRTELKIDRDQCRGDLTYHDYRVVESVITGAQSGGNDRTIEYELLESYPNVRMQRSASHILLMLDGTLDGRVVYAGAVPSEDKSGKGWWRGHDGSLD